MTPYLAVALAALLARPPPDLADGVPAAFRRARLRAPAHDPKLSAAAEALARRAARESASAATQGEALRLAISDAGASDAMPRVVVLVAGSVEAAAEEAARRQEIAASPATHFGAGVAAQGDRAAAVLLLSDRRAEADPFPRRVEAASAHRLSGRLLGGLGDPRFAVTLPDGRTGFVDSDRSSRDRFSGVLRFPLPGRYTVEVLGRGERGPEVAAIFQVVAGEVDAAASPLAATGPPLPDTVEGVVEAINRRRAGRGLLALSPDDTLTRVAREHSEDMAVRNYFGHLTPEGVDLKMRLDAAGYAYRVALENLGEAKGPLAAHAQIEQSPGHLANVIDPEVTRVGVGVARAARPEGPAVTVTEVFARPSREGADDTPQAVLKAINAERARRAVLPVAALAELDAIARDHVQKVARAGDPDAPVPDRDLTGRALLAVPKASVAAADVFVADAAADALASSNVGRREFNRVGIATVRAAAARLGRDRLWIVVLYASVR